MRSVLPAPTAQARGPLPHQRVSCRTTGRPPATSAGSNAYTQNARRRRGARGAATAVSCSSQPDLIATRTLPRVSRFAPPAGPSPALDPAGARGRPGGVHVGQRSAKWMNGLQFVSLQPAVKSPKSRQWAHLAATSGRKTICCKTLRDGAPAPAARVMSRPWSPGPLAGRHRVSAGGCGMKQYSERGEFMQHLTPPAAPPAAAPLRSPKPAPASRAAPPSRARRTPRGSAAPCRPGQGRSWSGTT